MGVRRSSAELRVRAAWSRVQSCRHRSNSRPSAQCCRLWALLLALPPSDATLQLLLPPAVCLCLCICVCVCVCVCVVCVCVCGVCGVCVCVCICVCVCVCVCVVCVCVCVVCVVCVCVCVCLFPLQETNIAPFTASSHHVYIQFHAEYATLPSGFRLTWSS